MAAEDKPVQKLICLISLMVQEEHGLSQAPSLGKIASGIFEFVARKGPRPETLPVRQLIFSDWQKQEVDHSTVPAVLAKIEEMQAQRMTAQEAHIKATERLKGFDYRIGDSLRIWIGTEDQFETYLARPAGIREKGATLLFNEGVTADNILGVLKNFNTAETVKARQDAIESAITSAIAPPKAVKPMKRLQIKKDN